MTGDHGLDQGDGIDPAAAIRRYCRSIGAALTVIDQANDSAYVVTDRMRATVETLIIDLGELQQIRKLT